MNINGKLITLRAIEASDLNTLHSWANKKEISEQIHGWHFPSNMNDQMKWFDQLSLQSNDRRFGIENEKKELIGTANLIHINWKDRNAEHGMLIGEEQNRGKGYAQDTIMTVMRYAFEELNLNRLETTIIEYNKPSLTVYKNKCGWKEEGRMRKWYFRKNQYWDRVMVAILKDEYEYMLSQKNYWDK